MAKEKKKLGFDEAKVLFLEKKQAFDDAKKALRKARGKFAKAETEALQAGQALKQLAERRFPKQNIGLIFFDNEFRLLRFEAGEMFDLSNG